MYSLNMPATPIVLVLISLTATSAHDAKWTYTGQDGEQYWSKHYPFCSGVFQSPIDFQFERLRYDPTLASCEVNSYHLPANKKLTLTNNGHSVQLSLPSTMYISGLANRYSASQLHLHWGSPRGAAGSEHTVDGRRFPAEMHVVHFNSDKYANVSVAANKSDGLAVLGILIQVGKFNEAFDQFLRYITDVKYKGQRVQVPGFNIRDLLPANLDQYYRYSGSLTTPPCYPSVLWTVFRNAVTISHSQLQELATSVYSTGEQESDPVILNGNYRKTQSTDGRIILVSFQEGVLVSIVVASVLALALIVTLIWCLYKRTRVERSQLRNEDVINKPADKEEGFSNV